MEGSAIISMTPTWTSPQSPIPVYFSATVAGVFPQRVTVTDRSGAIRYIDAVESGPTARANFGAQFVNSFKTLPFVRGQVLQFSVTIEYQQNNSWKPSSIVAKNGMSLGDKGFMVMVASNDGGGDSDYNDCIVTITAWNQSNDAMLTQLGNPNSPFVANYCPTRPTFLLIKTENLANTDDQVMIASLQGLVARQVASICELIYIIDSKPFYRISPSQQQEYHSNQGNADQLWLSVIAPPTQSEYTDPWDLVSHFAMPRDSGRWTIQSYFVYESPVQTNTAMIYASIYDSLPVTGDQVESAKRCGLTEAQVGGKALDLTKTIADLLQVFEGSISKLQAFEIDPNKVLLSLRDYAVMTNSAVFFGDTERSLVLSYLNPGGSEACPLFGWGNLDSNNTEKEFIRDASSFGSFFVPSDWAKNLSVFSSTTTTPKPAPVRPASGAPDLKTLYVSFILSDGDNLQWLLNRGNFPLWWGSSSRGLVPLGWTISPSLWYLAPAVWNYYMDSAKETDCFVIGPSGIGFSFFDVLPATGLTRQLQFLEFFVKASGIQLVSIFSENSLSQSAFEEKIGQFAAGAPGLNSVFYASFSPWVKSDRASFRAGRVAAIPYASVLDAKTTDQDMIQEIRSRAASGGGIFVIYLDAWSTGFNPTINPSLNNSPVKRAVNLFNSLEGADESGTSIRFVTPDVIARYYISLNP